MTAPFYVLHLTPQMFPLIPRRLLGIFNIIIAKNSYFVKQGQFLAFFVLSL